MHKNIDHLTFGSGEKNLVVIPGLSIKKITASPSMLKNSFKLFLDDFTVTVLEYTDEIEEGYNIHKMAEEALALLDELGILKAYFSGSSMGGMVTMDILGNHPERVIKATLSSTVTYIAPEDKALSTWAGLAEKGDGVALAASMLDMIFSEKFLNMYRKILISMYKEVTKEELRKVTILSKACLDFNIEKQLNMLSDEKKASVMVLGAMGDKVFSPKRIIGLADLLGCKRYIYDAEFGHAVYDEAPDFYNRVLSFLNC